MTTVRKQIQPQRKTDLSKLANKNFILPNHFAKFNRQSKSNRRHIRCISVEGSEKTKKKSKYTLPAARRTRSS